MNLISRSVFDTGVYKISSTLKIPVGSIVVGEAWPIIMASGTAFNSQSSPTVAVQVGNAGDVGSLEISGMLFSAVAGSQGNFDMFLLSELFFHGLDCQARSLFNGTWLSLVRVPSECGILVSA